VANRSAKCSGAKLGHLEPESGGIGWKSRRKTFVVAFV
jgi:hypothetical protein